METIKTIVLHSRAARHIGEIGSVWLLRRFGEKKYPGISKAEIVFAGRGGEDHCGCPAEEFERKGILFIGAGGGRLDEHPTLHQEEKAECSCLLVAKDLGINNDPALEEILTFIADHDSKRIHNSCHLFDLASLVKDIEQRHQDKPDMVMNWAMMGLDAKYQVQRNFLTIARQEFEEKARVEKTPGPNGKTLTIVAIESNNEQVNKFARSAHGAKANIVIQKQPPVSRPGMPGGNVQIYTQQEKGLTLDDAARMLRNEENPSVTDWKELAKENRLVANWYYFRRGGMLLNGSLSAPDVPPTRLSLERIKEIVCIGVNPNAFEPSRASKCQKGVCAATSHDPCDWYKYGLQRCRKIRYDKKQEEQK